MNPTPVEKLILVMLSEIYDTLHISGGTVDGAKVKAAITSGNYWSLPTFHHEDYDQAEADYVQKVLRMWEHIEKSVDTLSPEDKGKLPVGDYGKGNVRFPGFYSSKRGTRCWSVAEHMTDHLGLWSRFSGRLQRTNDDAHDLEERYDNMLEIYWQHAWGSGGKSMRVESIISLLNAFDQSVGRGESFVDYDEPDYDITDY